MKNILLYLFILLPFHSYSQNKTVKIVNSKTSQPVSFAKILIGNNYILSNYSGQFHLDSNYLKLDSCQVSCIGFETNVFSISELRNDSILKLIPSFSYLEEVEVTSKKVKYLNTKLGVTTEPDNKFFSSTMRGQTGEIKAVWIPNDKSLNGKIESINVYVSDMGVSSSYFRIHLYNSDPLTLKPKKEFLNKNIVAKGNLGNEWVSINIKELGISIPKDGFFVGVEWLPATKNESFSDTIVYEGNRYDKRYEMIYDGNGVVLGVTHQKYYESKYKVWYLDSLRNDWEMLFPLDESIFFIEDTLQNGMVNTPTPHNYYKSIPCIYADVRYVKGKGDNVYHQGKKRKLNKLEKTKENLFLYPQNSIENLFGSLIKAFQKDDIVYVLRYLCVYKEDEFKRMYSEIKEVGIDKIISLDDKTKIIEELGLVLENLSKSKLMDKGTFCYELSVLDLTYNLSLDNGKWKINPYSHKIIK